MGDWTLTKRPQVLSALFGLNNVKTYFYTKAQEGNFPKAVLFKGQFGNGKTTTAKIVAKMMACKTPEANGDPCNVCASCMAVTNETYERDVLLIDGGTSGKAEVVDTVADFIATAPMYDKRKIVIVEETQELSTAARNSFLKVLENPRANVHFILLSMEQGKTSAFASRCVPFNFKKATVIELMMYMKSIMEQESLWANPEIPEEFKLQGLATIAQSSAGSLRQALQVLDQCLVSKFYTSQEILDNLGIADEATVMQVLSLLLAGSLDFWGKYDVIDSFEFFAVSLKIVAEAAMFRTSGYLANEQPFFANNTKMIAGSPHFELLQKLFKDLGPLVKPYIRKNEMTLYFAEFFANMRSVPSGVKVRVRGQ
jgi:DNA polymerase-3 subunit gamma/tau